MRAAWTAALRERRPVSVTGSPRPAGGLAAAAPGRLSVAGPPKRQAPSRGATTGARAATGAGQPRASGSPPLALLFGGAAATRSGGHSTDAAGHARAARRPAERSVPGPADRAEAPPAAPRGAPGPPPAACVLRPAARAQRPARAPCPLPQNELTSGALSCSRPQPRGADARPRGDPRAVPRSRTTRPPQSSSPSRSPTPGGRPPRS